MSQNRFEIKPSGGHFVTTRAFDVATHTVLPENTKTKGKV